MARAHRAAAGAAVALLALVLLPAPANALVPPTVTSVTLTGLTSGALSPVAGTTATFTATVVVGDLDGFADISTVTVGILKPDGVTVHLAQAAATFSSGSGNSATYTKSLAMNFYDAAALTTSTYKVKVIVTDKEALSGTNLAALTTFNYNQLVALNAPASFDVSAGGVNPGSGGAITSLSIQNYGNVQVDVQVSGTDLTNGGSTIPVGDISFGTASDLSGSSVLSTVATTLTSFDLVAGASSSRTLYAQLTTTPSGIPPGTYTGTLTLTAVSG